MKIKILIFFFLIIIHPCFAQENTNNTSNYSFARDVTKLDSVLYQYLDLWYDRRYISHLPLVRPYPPQVIIAMLNEVIESGNTSDRETAEEFLAELGKNTINYKDKLLLNISGGLDNTFTLMNNNEYSYKGIIDPLLKLQFGNFITAYSHFSFIGAASSSNFVSPPGEKIGFYTNQGEVGSINTGYSGSGVIFLCSPKILPDQEILYAQGGLMKSVMGPLFDDSISLNADCEAAGHYSFYYNFGFLTLSSVFLILNPKWMENPTNSERILIGKPAEKYLALHTLNFTVMKGINIGFLQIVMDGGRFNPAYLLPMMNYLYVQEVYGGWGSSFLGFFTDLLLPFNLHFKAQFILDDFNLHEFAKHLNLNSAQNKFALELGLGYTHDIGWLKKIQIGYTMITPYTFTHSSHDPVPYLSYTHGDSHIGSQLDPNSDEVDLKALFIPFSFLNITLFTDFTRHANASEGISQGDGSIYDDGYLSNGTVTFYGPSRFLTQDVIEYTLTPGFKIFYPVNLGLCEMDVNFKYMQPMTWNKGLIKGKEEFDRYVELGVSAQF